jgi:hypothetical protein
MGPQAPGNGAPSERKFRAASRRRAKTIRWASEVEKGGLTALSELDGRALETLNEEVER